MTVIVYTCDTCKRSIDIVQNKQGLESMQRCIITDGCRGKLTQSDRLQDYLRGSPTARVLGLEDWSPRKMLFTFRQSVENTIWHVVHDLGVFPAIQIYVNREMSVPYDPTVPCKIQQPSIVTQTEININDVTITVINDNSFTITFPTAQSGTVQCVARSSAPKNSTTVTPVSPAALFQLTNSSELSVATILSSTFINVTLTFITPAGALIDMVYSVDNIPSINSPWNDANTVVINGKIYVIRSFDFIAGHTEFTNGTIPTGSSFYIKQVNGIQPAARSILLLLSNSPYNDIDKVVDRLIDPTRIVSTQQAQSAFVYQSGQLFGLTSLLESVYPYIYKV